MAKISTTETTKEDLLGYALGYQETMHALLEKIEGAFGPAVALLGSHAIELALKSFLVGQGYEDVRKIGHDIEKAGKLAHDSGLDIPEEPPFTLKLLALHHGSPYLYRYPQKGIAAGHPTPEDLSKTVSCVIGKVSSHLLKQ